MNEVLYHYRSRIEQSQVLERLGLEEDGYFVVSVHREENIDAPQQFRRLAAMLEDVARVYGLPVIVSLHPRTRKRMDAEGLSFSAGIRMEKPLAFTDYVRLMTKARATLSDSGTITEESSILNFRALNLREAHERPEGMEEGAVMMTGLDPIHVLSALKILEAQPAGMNWTLRMVEDYNVPNVSEKIVRILHSYTGYVNRVVWRKYPA
jgi:UDP-N-acetylglucosamine 2-epimerase (non-hydrolysing)